MVQWIKLSSILWKWDTSKLFSSIWLFRAISDIFFRPQPRQTSADFLVAVTDPNGRFVKAGFEDKVPKTAAEFAEYFKNSKLGLANLNSVQEEKTSFSSKHLEEYAASAAAEHVNSARPTSNYLISYPMQIKVRFRLADII